MAGQREKPLLVLRPPAATHPLTCPSAEKTRWAVKLKYAANVRTCIFKPRLLQINTKTLSTLALSLQISLVTAEVVVERRNMACTYVVHS